MAELECVSAAPTKTGSFKWTIQNWSALPNDFSQETFSAEMEAAGHVWRLGVFPGGHCKSNASEEEKESAKASVRVDLDYFGTSHSVKAKYSVTLVNHISGGKDKCFSYNATFGKERVESRRIERCLGWSDFIKRSLLKDESRGFMVNDTVTFRCEITTYGEVETVVNRQPSQEMPSQTISSDMVALFEAGTLSDMTIHVGTEAFHAHSHILAARSPYFLGMLSNACIESRTLEVTENEIDADVFDQLLRFIYSDSAPPAEAFEAMGEHLLLAANKYSCDRLKKLCELELCASLDDSNAAARLVLADQADAKELKREVLAFIKEHTSGVMESSGFSILQAHRGGALVSEILSVVSGHSKKRSASEAGLTEDSVNRMKITELKDELSRRSLDTSGRKPELVTRLLGTISPHTNPHTFME